ncbi:MAG TPA: hypothetical protein VE007_09335 [Thermoanaerobaculia bacterium]|nr:hypothetical protein [Thermoanaerobaculia bacterium]
MSSRRATAGLLAAAALAPPIVWLFPALALRQAPTFRDQGDFFFPLKLHTADRLRRGELPLWNPLSGGGEPWLANLQSGVYYPPGLFFLLPSPALAAGLYLLLHFAAAAFGMRAFLRQEGVSESAALAGSAAFTASGFSASLSSYWNHFGAFAWLPALAFFARRGLRTRSDRLAFAGLLALQALSGSPEMSIATAAVAALFVWRSRPEPEGGFAAGLSLRLRRLAAAAALGVVLAAAALVPFAELASVSDRRGPLPAPEREAGSVGRVGFSSAIGRSPGNGGTSYLTSLAAGTLTLLFAAAAFRDPERRGLALLLAAIGAAGILLAASAPPGTWVRAIPPLDRFRYPAKALALTAFSLSVLAGLGLDALRFSPAARRRGFVAALGAAGLLLVLVSRQPALCRIAEAAGILALAALALVPATLDRPALSAVLEAVAALLLAASLIPAGTSLFRFAAEAEVRRPAAAAAFLRSVPGRVLTPPMGALVSYVLRDGTFDTAALRRQRESLLGYTNLLQGIRTLRTASPLATQAARRIADTVDTSRDPQPPAGQASVRVVWTPFLPENMGSRRVGDFYRAPVNPYRPRLSFARGFSLESDPARAWQLAAAANADARRVVLDRAPIPAPIEGSSGKGFVVARIAEDRPERVVAEVSSDAAGILVLTDVAYPGWKAQADGSPAEILLADGVFRAVALPAGSHRVVFVYKPASVIAGAALSIAGLIVFLFLARSGEPRRAGAVL